MLPVAIQLHINAAIAVPAQSLRQHVRYQCKLLWRYGSGCYFGNALFSFCTRLVLLLKLLDCCSCCLALLLHTAAVFCCCALLLGALMLLRVLLDGCSTVLQANRQCCCCLLPCSSLVLTSLLCVPVLKVHFVGLYNDNRDPKNFDNLFWVGKQNGGGVGG